MRPHSEPAARPKPNPMLMADLLCTAILLCRGSTAENKPFWAYIAIKPSDAEAFVEAQRAGAFNLEDYGTILQWGEGEHPPADVKATMLQDYGIRDDYEEWLKGQLNS